MKDFCLFVKNVALMQERLRAEKERREQYRRLFFETYETAYQNVVNEIQHELLAQAEAIPAETWFQAIQKKIRIRRIKFTANQFKARAI